MNMFKFFLVKKTKHKHKPRLTWLDIFHLSHWFTVCNKAITVWDTSGSLLSTLTFIQELESLICAHEWLKNTLKPAGFVQPRRYSYQREICAPDHISKWCYSMLFMTWKCRFVWWWFFISILLWSLLLFVLFSTSVLSSVVFFLNNQFQLKFERVRWNHSVIWLTCGSVVRMSVWHSVYR